MEAFTEYARRVTNSLLRRMFLRAPTQPLERIGTEYGGYLVPLSLIDPSWTVYSVGVGEDVSFDLELVRRTGCRVRAFDPTPRAARHLAALPELPPQHAFFPFGLWTHDGEVRFFVPRDPSHVSLSIDNIQGTAEHVSLPVKTLRSTMHHVGDARIDLLKLDVEGAEYAVLADLLTCDVRPQVICSELHHPWPLRNILLLARLASAGYQLVGLDGPTMTLMRAPPTQPDASRRA
jgi:FkbM family methyltransferase